ncbi:Protein of unknown function [Pseudarcicella hirudinis]|uniref:DUF1232 domain-containing protein n=2 Tax=Pseudarcicella hirudinis TaxID=1079859 RepID=A0A1I5SHG5_9BACT|nr:YkvA family protein [Pseudarcicella hirudinis]SFP70165.1 Protein of unknown function [Pseudarcicella hirudinis]
MPQEDLVSKVLNSVFFRRATHRAGKYAGGSLATLQLLKEVIVKARNAASRDNKQVGQVLLEKLTLLGRMVKAYVSGDYRIVPWQTIVKIIAVLIYFVSPIDLIPDVLPAIGLTDDLALILWLFNALSGDIRDFELWEKTKAELVETTINLD